MQLSFQTPKIQKEKNEKIIDETIVFREELRKRLPTIEKMHDFCTDELEYYMPRYESWNRKAKCINEEYLWGVIIGKYWSVKAANIKFPKKVRKAVSKREMVEVLEQLVKDKHLGFDQDHYPDKQWLKTTIYSLNPSNPIFLTPQEALSSTVPKE